MAMSSKYEMKILIAEDEELPRELLSNYLRKLVEYVAVAKNGTEAMELVATFNPDVIIVDYNMLGFTGLEVIKAAKRQSRDIKSIIVTAHNDVALLYESIEIGVDKFMTKPFIIDKVRELIDYFYEGYKARSDHRMALSNLKEFSSAINAVAIVSKADPNGVITYVNDYFCKVCGYSKEELIGKTHAIVRHPETPTFLIKNMWETILSKKIWRGRIKNRKKSGELYMVESSIVPILNEKGEIKEFVSVRVDVTENYLMQKEMTQREKAHLESMNKSKDNMLILFTHELKTPLNAIINFSDILQKKTKRLELESDVRGEFDEFLSVIKNSGSEMLDNITSIIDLVKLKSGKVVPNISIVDVKDLAQDVINIMKPLLDSVKLETKIAERATTVATDPAMLRQVIFQIVSNGVKYGKGKVLFELKTAGKTVQICISDGGAGFKDVTKIGGLFEQFDDDMMTRTSKGLGVGLHLVKMICEMLQYELEIENNSSLGGAKVTLNMKSAE